MDTDVIILGGGLVGATLALALDAHGVGSIVVDPADPAVMLAPGFDGRASAIASASGRMLDAIGVGARLAGRGCAIRHIRVSDGLAPGKLDFRPGEHDDPLGTMYENKLLRRALNPGAPVVVQSTSPLMARNSFWCVAQTLEAAGMVTRGYHVAVPSFGEWGYVLARDVPFDVPSQLAPIELHFLNDAAMQAMFIFPADMQRVPTEVNRLDNQVLVQYYEDEWKRWN